MVTVSIPHVNLALWILAQSDRGLQDNKQCVCTVEYLLKNLNIRKNCLFKPGYNRNWQFLDRRERNLGPLDYPISRFDCFCIALLLLDILFQKEVHSTVCYLCLKWVIVTSQFFIRIQKWVWYVVQKRLLKSLKKRKWLLKGLKKGLPGQYNVRKIW